MPSALAARGMLKTDGLRVLRDRFLIGIAVYIVGISIAMRWAIPWVTGELAVHRDFDLTPYHALIVSHILIQLAPLLPGIVGVFLLLESREDGTVKALLVCPVPLPSYVGVLCIAMLAVSCSLTVGEAAIIGMGLPPWSALIGAGIAGAPAALMLALFVAAMANNKVEAFAYMKFCGVAPLIPTGAFFLGEPWQWLAAVYPPYWASKAYWVAESGGSSWPLWVLGGLITSAVWVAVLGRVFLKAARK